MSLRTSRLSAKPTPRTKEQTLSKGTNWCAENGVCVYKWISGIFECVTVCDVPDIILAGLAGYVSPTYQQLGLATQVPVLVVLIRPVLRIRGQKEDCTEVSNDSLLN